MGRSPAEPSRAPAPAPSRAPAPNRAPAPSLAPTLDGVPARIAFLGFGLIGGSIAMALRARAPEVHLSAWTPNGRGPAEGRRRGMLDAAAASPTECVARADLVVLAGPPQAVLGTLADLAGPLGTAVGRATLTDVASTKSEIVQRADRLGAHFVGGHPMAGREASGVESAASDLFLERPWVVVPGEAATAIDIARVEALATTVGARPIRMGAREHDAAVAAISHLPLLAAAALVEAVTDDGWQGSPAAELAASGWRDMTRLAAGSPEMGAGILTTNLAEVLPRLHDLRAALDSWIGELERTGGPDEDRLRERLAAARDRLRG